MRPSPPSFVSRLLNTNAWVFVPFPFTVSSVAFDAISAEGAPASSAKSNARGSPCRDPTRNTRGFKSGTPNAAAAIVRCAHRYPSRSNSETRSHTTGTLSVPTPLVSDSSSAAGASTSTHATGLVFISRSTCLSLDATESFDQLSRQLPSSSASITDATSKSTSFGSCSISLGSRGWQMPWNRAASTSRAAGSDSVWSAISCPACVRP